MMRVVAVSGIECVDALVSAGFCFEARGSGTNILTKGDRLVVVPDIPRLAPEAIRSILDQAGLTYAEFVELLAGSPTSRMPRLALG
jgi:hypothetical protein